MAVVDNSRPVLAPLSTEDLDSHNLEDQCHSGAKVRDIASKLENVLMSPDAVGASPGHWMMGRPSVHTRLSRRQSSNGIIEAPATRAASRVQDSWYLESPAVSSVSYNQRTASPSKPNSNRHASQSFLELKQIYDDSSSSLERILALAVRKNRSFFRRRSSFTARLMSTAIILSQITGFWKKFGTLMTSTYTNETTPGSMLSSVLVMLVEGRQAFLDVFNFGKSIDKSYRNITSNQLVELLLNTLQRLQKQRDSLLYFVGHRRATRATANGTMRRRSLNDDDGQNDKFMQQTLGSSIVNAPLLLLRDRLSLCVYSEDVGSLFPDIHQIEGAVASFSMQSYEEWTTLLFEADTIGTAVMDLAKRAAFRRQLYSTLTQVFVCARSNALSALSNEHSLFLVA
uniref:Uncharacterized protein n=1 Tax=Spongospora subterranea TaxID=70186 RepID=A0A0H5QJU3_9EUKA|eukprot:CRZ01897.1 hypothetical protein [Spongospora subterranea]